MTQLGKGEKTITRTWVDALLYLELKKLGPGNESEGVQVLGGGVKAIFSSVWSMSN